MNSEINEQVNPPQNLMTLPQNNMQNLDVNNQNKTNETIFTKFNPHSMYDNNLKLTRPENAFAAGKKNRKTKKNNRNTKKLTKKTNVHKKQNKHRNKTHKKLSKTLSTKKK
jgi:hypothetical protein